VSLTPGQISALRDLEEVWPERAIVIIGATALGFYHDMTWRKTADVDIVVAVEIDEFPGQLVERPGWTRHPSLQHRFESPRGVKLDILPAGDALLKIGTIDWDSGHVISLAGLDLAFRHAASHEVEADFVARVAPPAVVTVLKMASYLDRPEQRLRDLDDIAHLLDSYVEEGSPRFWGEAIEYGEYELAPAYLLGFDIGRIAAESHLKLVEEFISRVGDVDSIDHAQMLQRGPRRWLTEDRPLHRRFNALRAGLTLGGPR